MTVTNWHLAEGLAETYPNTFHAVQRLVMAVAEAHGITGILQLLGWGSNKRIAAYDTFQKELYATLCGMAADGLIEPESDPSMCRRLIVEILDAYASAFPNWPDAYAFAHQFFVIDDELADALLAELLKS